jgi:hypothetical protein
MDDINDAHAMKCNAIMELNTWGVTRTVATSWCSRRSCRLHLSCLPACTFSNLALWPRWMVLPKEAKTRFSPWSIVPVARLDPLAWSLVVECAYYGTCRATADILWSGQVPFYDAHRSYQGNLVRLPLLCPHHRRRLGEWSIRSLQVVPRLHHKWERKGWTPSA